jgi:hypothetical protein
MAVRIVLNEQGDTALKNALTKLKAFNPGLCKIQNALVSQAVIELAEDLSESKMKTLAEKLLSRASKRKNIIHKISTLAKKLDDTAFQSLENYIKKGYTQFEKTDPAPKSQSG